MDIVDQMKRDAGPLQFIGPFEKKFHVVALDGYKVPYLEAVLDGENVTLRLDERFEIQATRDEAHRWVWFMANAMAISAGLSCHGKNARRVNPHQVRLVPFGTDDDEGELVEP